MDYAQRSERLEMLDGEGIPFAAIRKNMQELEFINQHLGGHAITLQGFQAIAGRRAGAAARGKPLEIVEIGCGGGDNIAAIHRHCMRQGLAVHFTGIDINPECIAYAWQRHPSVPARWVCSDYLAHRFESPPDVIFSSLFCHHFSDAQLVTQLRWMQAHAGLGFFVNDLHRHPLAYHAIRVLTALFSRSELVRHDAPLSVLRGFSRRELQALFAAAGIPDASVRWRWAFRWLASRQTAPG